MRYKKSNSAINHLIFIYFIFLHLFLNNFANSADNNNTVINADNQILWIKPNIAPGCIKHGKHQNKGYIDQIFELLVAELPTYKHFYGFGNFKEITNSIKQQSHICSPALFKTPERSAYIVFSKPLIFVLSNGIIIYNEKYHYLKPLLDDRNHVSLSKLLTQSNLKLGIAKGRSYNLRLDNVIQTYSHRRKIKVAGDGSIRSLLNLLYDDKFDYILGYSTEMTYFSQLLEENKTLKFITTSEANSYSIGRVGCSLNKWGKKLIHKINYIIDKNGLKTFSNFYNQWLDEKSQAYHKKLLSNYLRQKINK